MEPRVRLELTTPALRREAAQAASLVKMGLSGRRRILHGHWHGHGVRPQGPEETARYRSESEPPR